MKEPNTQQFVTLDIFNETLERLMGHFDKIEGAMATKSDLSALESKMMQGFEAFDMRLNIFETSANRNFKTLSAQIQHLTLAKADWQDGM